MRIVQSLILVSLLLLTFLMPGAVGRPIYEINVQIHAEDYNGLTLSHLSDLGVGWVRMDYETGTTEAIMTALHAAGYKVLAIIDNRTAPFTTLEAWNNTVQGIAANPAAQLVDAWEIWNEPNALEGAYIPPSVYVEMLRCAYAILKNSTKGLVVSGGLAPHENLSTYLKETFSDSEIGAHYDYFGLHLYGSLPENLALISEAKATTGKEVWVTEVGVPSQTANYTPEGQAAYLAENVAGTSREARRIFVYELYDNNWTWIKDDKEHYFGLLTTAYDEKPAYLRLKELGQPETSYDNSLIAVGAVAAVTLVAVSILLAHRSRRLKADRTDAQVKQQALLAVAPAWIKADA